MMVGMGFFIRSEEQYRMAVPRSLDMHTLKVAALKLAMTEDVQCYLHPERLLTMTTKKKASHQQARLSRRASGPRLEANDADLHA
jgi:hypothetical protein